MKNPDDKQVTVGYESSRNITFHDSGNELGYTWGEWRNLARKEQDEAIVQFLFELVDVYVEDEEDE